LNPFLESETLFQTPFKKALLSCRRALRPLECLMLVLIKNRSDYWYVCKKYLCMKSSMYGATLNSEVVIVSSQYLL